MPLRRRKKGSGVRGSSGSRNNWYPQAVQEKVGTIQTHTENYNDDCKKQQGDANQHKIDQKADSYGANAIMRNLSTSGPLLSNEHKGMTQFSNLRKDHDPCQSSRNENKASKGSVVWDPTDSRNDSYSQGTQTENSYCDCKKQHKIAENADSFDPITDMRNDPCQSNGSKNNASKNCGGNKNIRPQLTKEQLTAQLENEKATVIHLMTENKKLNEIISEYMHIEVEKNTKGKCDIVNDPKSLKHIASNFDAIFYNEWEQAFDVLKTYFHHGEMEILMCLKEILESCSIICFQTSHRSNQECLLDTCKDMEGRRFKWLQTHIEVQIGDTHPKYNDDIGSIESGEAEHNDQPSPGSHKNKGKKNKKTGKKRETTIQKETDNKVSTATSKVIRTEDTELNQEELRNHGLLVILRKPEILQHRILKEYINACLKSCWEASCCEPQLELKFAIENKSYAEVKSAYRYKEYALGKRNKKYDGRLLVVWPAVIYKDQTGNEILIETRNAYVIENRV